MRFIRGNNDSFTGLIISHIGLLIVSTILISAVISLIFFIGADLHRKGDLENIAHSFIAEIEHVNSKFIEESNKYTFPQKNYPYTVSLSSEFVTIKSNGNWHRSITVKKRYFTEILPLNKSITHKINSPLSVLSKELFHKNLKIQYQAEGYKNSPITQFEKYSEDISDACQKLSTILSKNPISIDVNKPIYLEKIIVYFENVNEIKTEELIIIHQERIDQ